MPLPAVVVNDVEIPYAQEVLNLGVTFDPFLSWVPHVINVCKKGLSVLSGLRRKKDLLPRAIRKKLVESLLFPKLDYASSVFLDASFVSRLRIQPIQNAGIRFIYDLKRDNRITPFRRELKWLNMEHRRLFSFLLFLFKIMLHKKPVYLFSMLQFLGNVRSNRHSFSVTYTLS